MKQECADALSSAAGRQLSKAELDGIDERIHGSMRDMAMADPDKYNAMSFAERRLEAAKMAKERMMADVTRAHESSIVEASRKAALFSDVDSVKPGLRGQLQHLKSKILSVDYQAKGIASEFYGRLTGLHEADGGKFFGLLQDPAKQHDIAKGLFGEQTTPEAAHAAKGLSKMLDSLADRFQRSGLSLNKRENWRLPQPQDSMKVAANPKAWVEDHMNWVDKNAYVNPDGSRMSNDQLRAMLEASHSSIGTDGANKRAVGEGSPVKSHLVGSSANAPRQLFYKNADSWSQAMQKYGRTTNMYELIASHVNGMSKDIATAEQFGKNADANVRQASDRAYVNDQKAMQDEHVAKGTDPAKAEKQLAKLENLQRMTQRVYDAYTKPSAPQNASAANLMAQLRGLMASSQLGSLVGALPDLAGLKLAAEHSGLPQMRVFRNFIDGIASGAVKQEFLNKMGIWQEGFQHMNNRAAEDGLANGWGTFLNHTTHIAMGLNAFDRGMRAGIGRTVLDTIGKFTREHATLEGADGTPRLLQDRGVTQEHWDVWKKAELDKGLRGNENLLTAQGIRDIADPKVTDTMKDQAIKKLYEIAYADMQFGARGASPQSVADRVSFGMDKLPAGTVAGEMMRFLTQFKSVPLGIFKQHYERMQTLDGWGSKAAYGAKFVGYSALMGALATELKAGINGQNPRNMNIQTDDGKKFWMEALASGGGFGLYGDLFVNGKTTYGSGLEALAGPGASALASLAREVNTAREDAMASGQSKHAYSLAALRFVKQNATPFANIWYAKAAFNRLVYDNMQDALSPGSSAKQQQRMEARGASYYWAPGANSQIHAPDLSKAWHD